MVEDSTFNWNFTWADNDFAYNSNCSWLAIVAGPCDDTKTDDPRLLVTNYDFIPFDNWDRIVIRLDLSNL